MTEEAKIRITLDPRTARQEAKRAKERGRKRGEQGAASPESIRRLREQVESRRSDLAVPAALDRQRALRRGLVRPGAGLTAGRVLVGGVVARGAGARLAGKAGAAGRVGRGKFLRFVGKVGAAVVRTVVLDKVVNLGFPVLSQLLKDGMKDFDTGGGSNTIEEVVKAIQRTVATALDEATDAVQSLKAEIAGTVRTVGETVKIAKGFAITGQDFGKLPSLTKAIRNVNVFEDKLKADVSEATVREATSNIGEGIREGTADLLLKMFDGGANK